MRKIVHVFRVAIANLLLSIGTPTMILAAELLGVDLSKE